MAYHYLVTVKASGAQHLCEASSPSVAIADAAAELITAERVDGNVLQLLQKSLETKRVIPVARAATPAAGAEGAEPQGDELNPPNEAGDGENQKPATSGGKSGSK